MLSFYLANFFTGMFLCNCIPHLCAGLRGEPFPSPFAKPPGKGLSSPLVNFLWGTLNLLLAIALMLYAPIPLGIHTGTLLLLAGWLLLGCWMSRRFGKVRAQRND